MLNDLFYDPGRDFGLPTGEEDLTDTVTLAIEPTELEAGDGISSTSAEVGGDVTVNVSSEKTAKVYIDVMENGEIVHSSGVTKVKGEATISFSGPRDESGYHSVTSGQTVIRIVNASRRTKITVSGERKMVTRSRVMFANRQ